MSQISFAQLANFNTAVPWGLWVSMYTWFVGISAGSFALIMLGNIMKIDCLKKLTRWGILLSLSTLLAGLLSIQIDLGHMERFPKLFLSPQFESVMAIMVWLYGVYFFVLLFSLRSLKKGLPGVFLGAGLIFSLAVLVMESLLFALPPGKHWHSPMFSLHFLSSSLVAAIAALIFSVGGFWDKSGKAELLAGLKKIALPLVVINFAIEILEMLKLSDFNLFLIAGNIIIIALLLKKDDTLITLGGFIALLNILLSKYHGLISAQLIEPFKGFSKAYVEPRLQFSYTPTFFEYLASIGLVCLAIVLFYAFYKVLPLTKEE